MGKKTPELNQVPDDSSHKTLTTPQDVEFVGVIITEVYFDEPIVGTDDVSEKNNDIIPSKLTLNSSPRLLEKPTVSIGDDIIGSPPPLPRHQVPKTETETITKHKITSNGYSEYAADKYDETESERVPTRPTSAKEVTNGDGMMILTNQDNQNDILDTSESSTEINKEKNSVSSNSASPVVMNDEKLQTTEPESSKQVINEQDKTILNGLNNQTEINIEQSPVTVDEKRFSPSPPPKSASPISPPPPKPASPPPKSASQPPTPASPPPPKPASPPPPKPASPPPKSASPPPPKPASPPPPKPASPPPPPSKSASPPPKSESPLITNEEITGHKDDETKQDVAIIHEGKDSTSLKIVNDMNIDSDETTEKQTVENNNNIVESSNKNTEEMSDNNIHTNIYNENYISSANQSTNNENNSIDTLDKNEEKSGEEVNNNLQSILKESKDTNSEDNNDEDNKNSTNVGEITQPVIEVS